jgi:hypothetical protein
MDTTIADPAELGRLQHRRAELVRHYERAIERVALFPNAVNRRQVTALELQIDAADRKLDAAG